MEKTWILCVTLLFGQEVYAFQPLNGDYAAEELRAFLVHKNPYYDLDIDRVDAM